MTVTVKQNAVRMLTEASLIHVQNLKDTLQDPKVCGSFADARKGYIGRLEDAIKVGQGIKLEEPTRLVERVRDLDLAETVALLHAAQDRLRELA